MPKRKWSNPLALAVLSLLIEKPMHPYELGVTMRKRELSDAIKLNTGSLYAVVDALAKHQLIQPVGTEREGKLPERTVYEATEAGKALFFEWLRSLIRQPLKEYPQYAAGLSFLAHLEPGEAAQLLEERVGRLEENIDRVRTSLKRAAEQGVDRLFQIETEYQLAMLEAEKKWTGELIQAIRDGSLATQTDGRLAWHFQNG